MDAASKTLIYRVFYFLLHSVFDIFELAQNVYTVFLKRIIELCHEFDKRKIFPNFEKIPRHVTVVLGPEEPSPKDLANLILWCLAAHITFISFYDHKGTLKKHEERIRLVVEAKKDASDHVIWHSNPDVMYKNGYVGRKIHVKVLSEEDGRIGVVGLIKQLAISGETEISLDSFDGGLRKRFEFPDPDLGLCCGKTVCMYGYPPWQTRVTEFLSISSHRNLTWDSFIQLLHRYNKCEQRFGK